MMGMRQRGEVLPGSYMRDDRGWEAKLHGARGRRRLLWIVAGAALAGLLFGAAVWRFWPTRTPLCLDHGQPCSAPNQCCAFNCLDGQCAPPAWNCKEMGQQCSHAYECCSYHCDDKAQCAPPPPPCRDHGQPCALATECCSGQCQEGKCHDPYHYECKQNAEVCEQDSECCGYLCKNGTCSDCGEDGAMCGRDEECCSYRCRDSVCKECGQHGSQCTQDEDCCSMFCREGMCEYHEEYDKEYGNEWYSREDQERWEREEASAETTHSPPPHHPAGDIDATKLRDFIPADAYDGARHGMVWRTGPRGTGYYPAHVEDIVRTSKQIELEKQAELDRQAAAEKQAELERQAAAAKQAELERQARQASEQQQQQQAHEDALQVLRGSVPQAAEARYPQPLLSTNDQPPHAVPQMQTGPGAFQLAPPDPPQPPAALPDPPSLDAAAPPAPQDPHPHNQNPPPPQLGLPPFLGLAPGQRHGLDHPFARHAGPPGTEAHQRTDDSHVPATPGPAAPTLDAPGALFQRLTPPDPPQRPPEAPAFAEPPSHPLQGLHLEAGEDAHQAPRGWPPGAVRRRPPWHEGEDPAADS